jgi:multidrug efflux pump subunit AcrA (membrane-fusion protein)
MQRARRTFGELSVSALDLFASALGVFILIAILMFPYYLRQPSIEIGLAGAQAELSAAQDSTVALQERVAELVEQRRAAEAEESAAAERLQRLRQARAAAADERSQLEDTLGRRHAEMRALGEKMAHLAILDLDLVFVMDTTGSMRDELEDIQANLRGIVRILFRLAPTLQVGFVAYKDKKDDYLVRSFPLAEMSETNLNRMLGFVNSLEASGGGDKPEPVDLALDKAVAMNWRDKAHGKIIVITDATVHSRNRARTLQMARDFRAVLATALPRSTSSIFTGKDKAAEQFLRDLAKIGGGDFSTHSGQMLESVLLSVIN